MEKIKKKLGNEISLNKVNKKNTKKKTLTPHLLRVTHFEEEKRIRRNLKKIRCKNIASSQNIDSKIFSYPQDGIEEMRAR